MIKNFTRKQLQEQLGFDAEETKIILDYQKKLPIIVDNNCDEKFCVNARLLHEQLKVGRKFTDWLNRRFDSYNFKENTDYILVSHKCESNNVTGVKVTNEYFLTMNCAEQLSMIERTEIGEIARQYYILLAEALRRNIEWLGIRNPERQGYKEMCSALNDYMIKTIGKQADDWDYRFEANALNIICTGFKALDIKLFFGNMPNSITRDSLTKQYNEYLYKMQEMDIVYLGMGLNRYQRYEMLNKTFNILYPDAQSIINNIEMTKIVENKRLFLEETKSKTNDSTLPFGLSV